MESRAHTVNDDPAAVSAGMLSNGLASDQVGHVFWVLVRMGCLNHKSDASQLLYCDGALGRRQNYTGLAGQLGSRKIKCAFPWLRKAWIRQNSGYSVWKSELERALTLRCDKINGVPKVYHGSSVEARCYHLATISECYLRLLHSKTGPCQNGYIFYSLGAVFAHN